MNPERPTTPEVDDDLLDPGEYEEACEEAERRTNRLVEAKAASLLAEQPDLLEDAIDNLDESGLSALALLITNSSDLSLQHWRTEQFRLLARDAVKPINEEEVLREWHPPAPDPDVIGDIKYERRRDDALDWEDDHTNKRRNAA